MTNKQKTNAIIRKIKYQFPSTPEGALFFSIIELAINDLSDNEIYNRESAINYINNDLSHAEACGISKAWIRELFKKAKCTCLLISGYKKIAMTGDSECELKELGFYRIAKENSIGSSCDCSNISPCFDVTSSPQGKEFWSKIINRISE